MSKFEVEINSIYVQVIQNLILSDLVIQNYGFKISNSRMEKTGIGKLCRRAGSSFAIFTSQN